MSNDIGWNTKLYQESTLQHKGRKTHLIKLHINLFSHLVPGPEKGEGKKKGSVRGGSKYGKIKYKVADGEISSRTYIISSVYRFCLRKNQGNLKSVF